VFAASDTQAMGVLAAADRYGVSVPGDLSVIGFDDIESAALLGLSTVRQPLVDSGAEGARRLCALLRGERVRPLRQRLPLDVVQRASTARPHAPAVGADVGSAAGASGAGSVASAGSVAGAGSAAGAGNAAGVAAGRAAVRHAYAPFGSTVARTASAVDAGRLCCVRQLGMNPFVPGRSVGF